MRYGVKADQRAAGICGQSETVSVNEKEEMLDIYMGEPVEDSWCMCVCRGGEWRWEGIYESWQRDTFPPSRGAGV